MVVFPDSDLGTPGYAMEFTGSVNIIILYLIGLMIFFKILTVIPLKCVILINSIPIP